MAMETQESTGTLSATLLAKIKQDLLSNTESDQPYHTHSQPDAQQQLQFSKVYSDSDEALRSLPATVPESLEHSLSPYTTPVKATTIPHLLAARSTPVDMEILVRSTPSQDASKAAPSTGSTKLDDNTQPMPSQVYHEERESMLRQSMAAGLTSLATPYKGSLVRHEDPPTIQSARSGTTATPRSLQQDQSGFVDLAAGFRESSPVHSTQGDDFDEFLQDPSSPQTQFQIPGKATVPETPTLAGQKHGRNGELLTSVTTAKTNNTSWGYSQAFGHEKAELMDRSQLFAQTQATSSPFPEVPRSDPIQSRPSPNVKDRVDTSSPIALPPNSSPMFMGDFQLAKLPGEPRTRYKTMAEEVQDRVLARAVSEQVESTNSDVDFDFELDSYQENVRAKALRRTLSDQAMSSAAKVKAPARPGPTRFSRGVTRPGRSERQREMIDIVTPGPVARRISLDDDYDPFEIDREDNVVTEREREEDLPAPNEYEDDGGDDDIGEDVINEDGNDEYDELNQGIRSQENEQEDADDLGSIPESVEQPGVEMEDSEYEECGVDGGELHQMNRWNTQRSTIADSQPLANLSRSTPTSLLPAQHSSMMSFVPGSQYIGRTSEELAFLPSSQRRSQSRIPASPLPEGGAVVTSKTSNNDTVLQTGDTFLEKLAAASVARTDILDHLNPRTSPGRAGDANDVQEIPESDMTDAEREEHEVEAVHPRNGNQETQGSNSGAPYSTARTHVSGSAQSPLKNMSGASLSRASGSQRSVVSEMTPRKAAGVRRFAEMAPGLTPSNGSFEMVDVDDIMNAVITDDDRRVAEIDEQSIGPPVAKRRRVARQRYSQLKSSPPNQTSKTDMTEGMNSSPSDSQKQADSDNRRAMRLPIALRDSPSKGNELSIPSSDELKLSTFEDTQTCETEGANAVSQLIAARPAAASKKTYTTTYGRGTKRRPTGKPLQGAGTKPIRQPAAEVAYTTNYEHGENDKDCSISESGNGIEDETSPIVAANQPDTVDTSFAGQGGALELLREQGNEKGEVDRVDVIDQVAAPNRIFALFKGSYQNFYPATWLGGSADGMTYKVRFDDTTVTNVETQHVSRLELQIGDSVKVDVAGMKMKIWQVVGFAPSAPRAAMRDIGGWNHDDARVKIQAKTTRKSVTKDAPYTKGPEDGEVTEVAISQVYLTRTMWPSFQTRTFRPPLKLTSRFERPTTPSSYSGTPNVETPMSRSRGGIIPTAKTKTLGPKASHLRDASVSSTNGSHADALFSGMAFAISYVVSEEQKAEVTRLITRHGGIILSDGFEELFQLPSIGEPVVVTPKKTSPRTGAGQSSRGLRLKEQHQELRFVALIADRHSRRAKYMQALALGLPTLSGRWIIDSLDVAKNADLSGGDVAPLTWERYLLPAGESSYLDGAIRSRTLTPYNAKTAELSNIISTRSVLLSGGSVVIVAPRKGKASWDKRKTYAFLTLALGAEQVTRVNDLEEARALLGDESTTPKWIYVDGNIVEACAFLFDKGRSTKKRKRGSDAIEICASSMSATHGRVRIINDEFVVQSLILGALAE